MPPPTGPRAKGCASVSIRERWRSCPTMDASFDVVLSMFGLMFAARPDRVASRSSRVSSRLGRTRRHSRTGRANDSRRAATGYTCGIRDAASRCAEHVSCGGTRLHRAGTTACARLDRQDNTADTDVQVSVHTCGHGRAVRHVLRADGTHARSHSTKNAAAELQADLLYLWERQSTARARAARRWTFAVPRGHRHPAMTYPHAPSHQRQDT